MLSITQETRNDLTLGELVDLINAMTPQEKQTKEDLREALRNG